MPLVFKEFIENISMFKFLDITSLFPFDINDYFRQFSPSEGDIKGPPKAIYYEYGTSFYKNMVPILISVAIIIFANLFVFFSIRFIPIKLFWRFSEKLRIRKLITLSDLMETVVLPVTVFSQFQFTRMLYQGSYVGVYLLMFSINLFVLVLPFIIIFVVFKYRRIPSRI